MTTRVAASLRGALELTPNQILAVASVVTRGSAGIPAPRRRRGTPDEFKAMLLGMVG